jgi:hypothetical protein
MRAHRLARRSWPHVFDGSPALAHMPLLSHRVSAERSLINPMSGWCCGTF